MAQVSIEVIDSGLQTRDAVKVCVHPTSSTTSLVTDDFDSDIPTADCHSTRTHRVANVAHPDPTLWLKTKEIARLSQIKLKVQVRDIKNSWQPKSEIQQPYHPTCEPLLKQHGNNRVKAVGTGRTLTNAQIGKVQQQSVTNLGKENHAGFYSLTDEEEQLHRLCLDKLPISLHSTSRYLGNTLHEKVAQFFGSDFCYTTSTDYAANILAFSAILDETWLLVIDDRSHDSMHMGADLSHVGQIIKFRHSDMVHLESILETERHKWTHALVAVEDLCSTEGTITNLTALDRLKEQYYFTLLANEAQSFGLLGCTGRGSVEYWNDQYPDDQLPMNLFDIRTTSFSRAFGTIGGVVCGNAQFASCIRQRREELYTHGMERLSPTGMVQALHNLQQPTKLRRKLERLRRIKLFMHQELTNSGIYVYEQGSTPGLSIHTARPTVAVKYAHVLRKHGVPANPISAPTVPLWQSRCHIPISADLDDAAVNVLLKALIDTAETCRIISKGKYSQRKFVTEHEEVDVLETQEARNSFKSITQLIDRDVAALKEMPRLSDGVIRAGHAARQQYSVAQRGSNPRPSHLDAERATCELLGMSETVLYDDSYFGLMSTMAALCGLPVGYRKHHVFLPEQCCQAVLDGVEVAPSKAAPSLGHYKDIKTLVCKLTGPTDPKAYTTVYFESRTDKSKEDLLDFFATIARSERCCNMRLLLNDLQLPGSGLQRAVLVAARECGVEILLFGSFSEIIHLPGAYLSGGLKLMSELRCKGHDFMSTASPSPFVAAMIAEGLTEVRDCSI